jgi:hypothetical protein
VVSLKKFPEVSRVPCLSFPLRPGTNLSTASSVTGVYALSLYYCTLEGRYSNGSTDGVELCQPSMKVAADVMSQSTCSRTRKVRWGLVQEGTM